MLNYPVSAHVEERATLRVRMKQIILTQQQSTFRQKTSDNIAI